MNLGSPIAIGNTAKLYLYENKAIKLFNHNLPGSIAMFEANKQKFAYSCGLPVPRILDVTEVDGKQAIIMEYIEGKTLGDLLSADKQLAEHYMNISIDIQQKIHRIPADSLEPMTEKLRHQITSAPYLAERQKSALLEKLGSMKYEKRLCHGDFHLFNLILSDNRVIILDWVDSSTGDIRADVYRTYLLYSQFSLELANLYLSLYCKHSGFTKDEIFEWAPIIAGARLSENVSSEQAEYLLGIVIHS